MSQDEKKMKFTDLYSTSELNHKVVFTDDTEGEATAQPGASPSFNNLADKATFTEKVAPVLPNRPAPSQATPPAVNGITWGKQRKKTRREVTTLNNGEPLSFAVRKMLKETFFILLCAGIIFGFFFAKAFTIDQLTNNTYSNLGNSAAYSKRQTVKGIAPVRSDESDGYACLQTLRSWQGLPVTGIADWMKENGNRDVTTLGDGMTQALTQGLPNLTVTRRENLTNKALLTQIYESLKAGRPVAVSCLSQDQTEMSYALVTDIAPARARIAMMRPDGETQGMDFAEFIACTRFEEYAKKPLSAHFSFMLGLHNKNTAYFLTEKEVV